MKLLLVYTVIPSESDMSRDDRHESSRSLLNRPFILVAAGFGLGYLVRFVLGPPAEELNTLNRRFERPMPAAMPVIDLPLERESGQDGAEGPDDSQ